MSLSLRLFLGSLIATSLLVDATDARSNWTPGFHSVEVQTVESVSPFGMQPTIESKEPYSDLLLLETPIVLTGANNSHARADDIGHALLGPEQLFPEQTDDLIVESDVKVKQTRYGSVEPSEEYDRTSFKDNFFQLAEHGWDDTRGLFTLNNLGIVGIATAAALVSRHNWDNDVREYTAEHPYRWGKGSEIIGYFGDFVYQVPVIVAFHLFAMHHENPYYHDFSMSMLSAYALTGITTLIVKAAANTSRPSNEWNGGQFGFPSYHAASTIAIASVVDEYFGIQKALPLYVLSGLVAWSRIDGRDHDLSDVMFGMALGYVIGKSVARNHRHNDSNVRILPFVQAGGGAGLMVDIAY